MSARCLQSRPADGNLRFGVYIGDYNSRPADRNLMFGGSSVSAWCLLSRPADRNLRFGVCLVSTW